MTPIARFVVGLILWGLLALASYGLAMTLIWYSQCAGRPC